MFGAIYHWLLTAAIPEQKTAQQIRDERVICATLIEATGTDRFHPRHITHLETVQSVIRKVNRQELEDCE